MDALFKGGSGRESLAVAEEADLIRKAQAGDSDASWALLVQYRGLLQKTANVVRTAVRLSAEQIEDLQANLVLEALEVIQDFDSAKFIRLSQVMPRRLQGIATDMTTSLKIPTGTLARWFKIWKAGDRDFIIAAELAPTLGMSTDTFRAIQHGLEHADSEWITMPWNADNPAADEETHALAHHALSLLSPGERAVIELVYGFSGEPKSNNEVSLILDSTPGTVKSQHKTALSKMRAKLV